MFCKKCGSKLQEIDIRLGHFKSKYDANTGEKLFRVNRQWLTSNEAKNIHELHCPKWRCSRASIESDFPLLKMPDGKVIVGMTFDTTPEPCV